MNKISLGMVLSDIVVSWVEDVRKRGKEGVRLRLVGRLRRVTNNPPPNKRSRTREIIDDK